MIEVKNLYKRYHNHHGSDWVLRNINFTIPSGVSVGLIGANGAGKSTLLRLIAGMDTPERGEVIRHSRVSWPIGLSGGMQGSMTGRQNVKFVARAQGRASDVTKIVEFVEDFAEIGEAFDEPVKTYSSGMRSRLSFGLSFAFDFDVYISDEATAVGDRAFKAKAQKLFQRRVGHSSLIMVSHSEGILRELCNAGVYIRRGEAIWYDDINDAILEYHLDIEKEAAMKKLTQRDGEDKSFVNKEDYDQLTSGQLTSDQLTSLRKFIQKKQSEVSSLWQVILKVKEAGATQMDIDLLKKLHGKWKQELDELKELVRGTSQEKIRIAKHDIHQAQKAILTIRLIEHKHKSGELLLGVNGEKVINDAIKVAQEYKAEMEAKLDSFDN